MKTFKYDLLLVILLFLLPLALMTGPFIPDLSISISSLMFIVFIISRKELHIFQNKYFFFYSLWVTYLIARSFLSENIFLSLEASLFYFRFIIFSSLMYYLLNKYYQFKYMLFFSILLAIIFIVLTSFHQFFFNENIFTDVFKTQKDSFHLRLKGPMFQSVLGSYLIRFLPILLSLYFMCDFKKTSIYLILILFTFLASILIILTGERNSILLLFVFFVFIFVNKYLNFFYRIILIISLLSTILFSFILLPSLKFRFQQTIFQFNFFNENILIENIYFKYFSNSFLLFKENIFFGVGPKLFRESCSNYLHIINDSCSTSPHNTYFQLLAEIGIFGTIPFILFFLYVLINQLKLVFLNTKSNINSYNSKYFILLAILLNFFPFSVAGNFFNNYISIIYYYPIGILLFILGNKKL